MQLANQSSDDVTGYVVFASHVTEFRIDVLADVDRQRAARVKAASAGRIHRTGHITDKNNTFSLFFNHRIGDWDSGEESLGIGMERISV